MKRALLGIALLIAPSLVFAQAETTGRITGTYIGVAISDETQSVCRPLLTIQHTSWKNLLENVKDLLAVYDAKAVIVGLPYNFDGTESEMTAFAREMARKFALSLDIPVLYMIGKRSTPAALGVARLLVNALPRVEVVEFEELGHMGPITHPDRVNEVIARFLART